MMTGASFVQVPYRGTGPMLTDLIAGHVQVPSVGERVSGYAASNWYGFAAPARTPAEIVSRLNTEITAALTDPKIKGRFMELGGTPVASSPAEFASFMAEDTEK